jgi:hypothetical protein
MSGAVPPLPQYAFMTWCSAKAQGQLYIYLYQFYNEGIKNQIIVSLIMFLKNCRSNHLITLYQWLSGLDTSLSDPFSWNLSINTISQCCMWHIKMLRNFPLNLCFISSVYSLPCLDTYSTEDALTFRGRNFFMHKLSDQWVLEHSLTHSL